MKNRNLFWGAFFILAAVLIILNQLDLLIGVSLFNLIITILLLPIIFKSIRSLNFTGIIFPLAIIGILYSENLGIEGFTPWPILGVALFLSIGLHCLFPNSIRKKYCKMEKDWKNNQGDFVEVIDEPDDSIVNLFTRFGGSAKYINSTNLKKVNIDCSFAGMEIYFDKAKMAGNQITVDVNANFAGVQMYIPKEWQVRAQLNSMIGGMDEEGMKNSEKDGKILELKGNVSFGGITIVYI